MSLSQRVPTWMLALVGICLLIFTGGHYAVTAAAWLAPVPWLLWFRRLRSWTGLAALGLALLVGMNLQILTIISDPIPLAFAPMFGVPMGLSALVAYGLAELLRRNSSERIALLGYAGLGALSDISAATGPAGFWGTAAANLSDSLVLLQLTSVTGIGGLGALTLGTAALLAALLDSGEPRRLLPEAGGVGAVLVGVIAFGSWRLAQPSTATTVPVAAVVTDLVLTPMALPSEDELAAGVEELFARTELAADRGARLIVWNEGATAVVEDTEAQLIARGQELARRRRVDLVLAFVTVTDPASFAFENKAVFIDDEGTLRTEYHKRHPVPGETAPSDNPVPRIERPYGVVSLGICYDHDFPEMSRAHAAVGADLVAVPSSDWAGIDPVHTRMARVRAIEGGFSSVRPVRAAASGAFDQLGRVRGWMRMDEDNERVMLAEVPVGRTPTVYAAVGDMLIGLPSGLVVLLWVVQAGATVIRRRRGRAETGEPMPQAA